MMALWKSRSRNSCTLGSLEARNSLGVPCWTILPPVSSAREDRASLCRCVADGNHIVKRVLKIAVKRLRLLPRDIDARFGHSLNRQRTDKRSFGTRAKNLKSLSSKMAQQPFGHL